MIKAVQQMNEESRMKNESLENEIAEIKNALSSEQREKLNSSFQSSENRLEQNNPNPFNQSTVIRYQLSSSDANSKIIVRDLNGKLVIQISISQSGKGKVTINANELAQGTYTYTLEVNGNSTDTNNNGGYKIKFKRISVWYANVEALAARYRSLTETSLVYHINFFTFGKLIHH
ncbi:MAG: T9SS type A sorting domain-containing protein [Parafilimonas sp.]